MAIIVAEDVIIIKIKISLLKYGFRAGILFIIIYKTCLILFERRTFFDTQQIV